MTFGDWFRIGLPLGAGAAVGWTVVTVGRKSLGLAVLALGMAAVGLGRWMARLPGKVRFRQLNQNTQ
jgi:hypothetical protein